MSIREGKRRIRCQKGGLPTDITSITVLLLETKMLLSKLRTHFIVR
jgi:hypothetical protein